MKRVQALFFLIILLSSFNVSAVNKNSYLTWKQKVIEQGRSELIRLQRINAQNDRKGQSDKNSYLVIVSGEGYPNTDFIQQRKGIGRGASSDVKYLLDEVMLNSLDGSLRSMNSQSEVDSYLLIVHFMPLEFVDVIPDNQSIIGFFSGRKNDLVDQVSEPIRDEARDIVTKITSAKLQTVSKPTLYCGFVNFQVFKNNKEGISQWVYYPRNGNIEFDSQYVNLLNGFVRNEKFPKDDISKIVTLVDLIKQNNDEYKRIKGTLASLYQITDPEKMRDEIRSVGSIGLAAFDLKQRIHALKVLTSARLDNGKEIQALNLLKTAPKRDYEGLLDSLVRVNQYSKSKESLLTCLVGRTDDEILLWGDDNYLELIRTITQLVFLSPVKETALDALVRDSGDRIYTWDKSYTLKILTTPPVGTNRYSVDLLDNGKVKVNRDYVHKWDCETYYQAKTDKPYEACDAIWETEPEQELDPFELVGFINRSDLSILNGVGEPDAKMIVVPALMLKYAQDKKINGDMAVGFFMSLDALTIAVPVTKVYNLAKIAQRIYLGLDLAAAAGSTANLIVNIQQVNPAFEAVVNKYNLVTGIINIAALAGGTKLAADVAGDFVNEVNKPGIKNSLIELAEQGNPEANKILLLERELVEEGKVAKVEWVDPVLSARANDIAELENAASHLDEINAAGGDKVLSVVNNGGSLSSKLIGRGISSTIAEDIALRAMFIDDVIGANRMQSMIDELVSSSKFKNPEDLAENLKSVFTGNNVSAGNAENLLKEFEEGKYWINQGDEVYISKKWTANANEVDVTIITRNSLVECKNITGGESAIRDRLIDIIDKFTKESKLSSIIRNQYPNHFGKMSISNNVNPYFNLNKQQFIGKVKLELLDKEGGIVKSNLVNGIKELHIENGQGRFVIKNTEWQ